MFLHTNTIVEMLYSINEIMYQEGSDVLSHDVLESAFVDFLNDDATRIDELSEDDEINRFKDTVNEIIDRILIVNVNDNVKHLIDSIFILLHL